MKLFSTKQKVFLGIGARKAIVKLTKVDASVKKLKENDRAEREGNDKEINSEMLNDIISETSSSQEKTRIILLPMKWIKREKYG